MMSDFARMHTYTYWVVSRRPTITSRSGVETVVAPVYSPGNVAQRPSTVGVFTRSVAWIDSAPGPCVGPRIGAERVPRTARRSVMSRRSIQSDMAKTTRGLNVGPRNERDADASKRVPTKAMLNGAVRASQEDLVSFQAYKASEVILPTRPRTSRSRSAVIPPKGMPDVSRSSVSTYARSTSSPAKRRMGTGGLVAFGPPQGDVAWRSGSTAPARTFPSVRTKK